MINSTRSRLYPTIGASSWIAFLPRCGVAGSGAEGSQRGSLRGTGVVALREKCWKDRGLGPARLAQFSPEPHTHSCDKSSPLATAIFRQEEGHVTLW